MFFEINRFHFFVLVTWQFTIFFASQQIFPIFSNYVPQWRCGNGPVGKNCDEYRRCQGNVTFIDTAFDSAAIEFGWICDNAYWASFMSQIQFAGVLLGTLSFGTVSDIIGRKPVSCFVTIVGIAASAISGAVTRLPVLFGARFVVGLAVGGSLVVTCTFVMEMLLPQQRMALRAFFNWGVARLMVTLICYFTREWRTASYVCACFAIPAFLILLVIFPESPTWLHSKGRLDEMRQSEKIIARRAGIPYVPVKHRKIVKSKSLLELIRAGLLKRLLVLWCMWFTASLCGYGTDLNSNTISGDLYINQILFSILIALSKIVLVIADTYIPHFSRRVLHQGAQLGAVCCFGALTVLTLAKYEGVAFLIINLIGTVFVEYTWDACYLCAVEGMETSSRATGMGSASLIARIGAIISPMVTHLNQYWSASLYLIVVILGTLNLIQSYFFLVETKGVLLDNVHLDENEDLNGVQTEEDEEAIELNNGLAKHD